MMRFCYRVRLVTAASLKTTVSCEGIEVKRLRRKDKVKRGRIILSAILTFAIALLALAFGVYLGYITLNINYLTIGTMTYEVGGLLVIAGFFIFFGCAGGVISLKEIFISSRNEERFSAYKGALYSAIVYYVVIAIISIAGIISACVNYIPSNYTWTIIALAVFSLLLCAGAFYCVFRELKEHKKKKKAADESACANMELSASDIHKLKNATIKTENQQENQDGQQKQEQFHSQDLKKIEIIKEAIKEDVDLYSLAEKLMQLEELRKAGLINDQEYQAIKGKLI